MPTIDEIITSAVNQLTTKRSNIRTALQSKYNETIPSSMTFGQVPGYITDVANYQYSLGLAAGGGGDGSYVNPLNASLEESYIVTGGTTAYNGTYTQIENTYHRGFSVYKKTDGSMYLFTEDSNGNRWQINSSPSETKYHYRESSSSSSSFSPVGTYDKTSSANSGATSTIVISGTASSSSSPVEEEEGIPDVWGGDLYDSGMASKQWDVSGLGDGSSYTGMYTRYGNYVLNGAPIYYEPTKDSHYYLIRRKKTSEDTTYGYWEFITTSTSINDGSTLPSGSFGKTSNLSLNNPAGNYTGLGSIGGSISVQLRTSGCGS